MTGTLLLLPVFFVRANVRLLDRACPAAEAPALLVSWSRWNWARTGLAVLATLLAGRAASTRA